MKASNANLKVSFYLKKNVSRGGMNPVMGRITVGKERVQFSCRLEVNPSLWDVRAGRMSGKSHQAQKVNRQIDKINVAINARYREILSSKGQATANEVKNAYSGNASAQETILKLFREHNEDLKKRIGVNRAKGTFWNYRKGYQLLEKFIQQKYHVSDLSFRQLDISFIENYDYFLRIDCRFQPGTVVHKMNGLKKIVRIAIDRGHINQDPFWGYSAERPQKCPKFVPMEELEKLMNMPMITPAVNFTRDMFVFSCFTGLAFIDLFHLTNRQIVKDDDDTVWLNVTRQKTGSISRIPLLDVPLQLIEKYRGTGSGDRVFPMKTATIMNLQLKKIAKHCGIERRLTFHMSRHTFATETCISQGVPIETVSKMMGHRDLSTTQIYADVIPSKVEEDMNALSDIIDEKYVFEF
jgi:site-specific recombinase XerD